MAIPQNVAAYVVDPLERAARTFGQQFIIFLMLSSSATGPLGSQHWLTAVEVSGLAAAVSIVTSVLTFWVPTQTPYADLVLRVVKTFAQSVAASLLLGVTTNVHVDLKGAIALALPVASSALLLGLSALGISGTAGASLLPVTINPAPLGKDAGSAVAVDSDQTVLVNTPSDIVQVPIESPDGTSEAEADDTPATVDEPGPRLTLDSLRVSDGPDRVADNPTRPASPAI